MRRDGETPEESEQDVRERISRLLTEAAPRLRDQHGLLACWLETPIGPMVAIGDAYGLHLLEFFDRTGLPGEIARLQTRYGPIPFGHCAVLDRTRAQLSAYFADPQTPFDVPVVQRGTAFEQQLWRHLQTIPPGQTRAYGVVAAELGRPKAVRAVGRANGANQVAVIIPCHRLVGADGALTGYGGKIWRKAWLLNHERQ